MNLFQEFSNGRVPTGFLSGGLIEKFWKDESSTSPKLSEFMKNTPVKGITSNEITSEQSHMLRALQIIGASAVIISMNSTGAIAAHKHKHIQIMEEQTSMKSNPYYNDEMAKEKKGTEYDFDQTEITKTNKGIMSGFTTTTKETAKHVHPDLLMIIAKAKKDSGLDFEIVPGTGGIRTTSAQKRIVANGASKTMTSRHLFGLAVDLVPVKSVNGIKILNLFDHKGEEKIYEAMKKAAKELGVPMKAGMDWKSFQDPQHFELDAKIYREFDPSRRIQTSYANTDWNKFADTMLAFYEKENVRVASIENNGMDDIRTNTTKKEPTPKNIETKRTEEKTEEKKEPQKKETVEKIETIERDETLKITTISPPEKTRPEDFDPEEGDSEEVQFKL